MKTTIIISIFIFYIFFSKTSAWSIDAFSKGLGKLLGFTVLNASQLISTTSPRAIVNSTSEPMLQVWTPGIALVREKGFVKNKRRKRTSKEKTVSNEEFSNDFFKQMGHDLTLPICDEDLLMVYLAELNAINPESIVNMSTLEELLVICNEIGLSVGKMEQYLQTCRILDKRDYYISLIKGVIKLNKILCEEQSRVRKRFEQHFDCLKTLHNDFKSCYGPPDWTEAEAKQEICKAFKEIADCFYIKSLRVCGKDAAQTMKDVVTAVISATTSVSCSKLYLNMNPSKSELREEEMSHSNPEMLKLKMRNHEESIKTNNGFCFQTCNQCHFFKFTCVLLVWIKIIL